MVLEFTDMRGTWRGEQAGEKDGGRKDEDRKHENRERARKLFNLLKLIHTLVSPRTCFGTLIDQIFDLDFGLWFIEG